MKGITPFLWFDDKAEEAASLYCSLFEGSRIVSTIPGPGGPPIGLTFELMGQEFMALNGGPEYTFTPAFSLFVKCETQADVDRLWEKLSEGGEQDRCGWLKDRYGVSWQIIPNALGEMLGDPDRERAGRVMNAMLQMRKIEIDGLKKAYEGVTAG